MALKKIDIKGSCLPEALPCAAFGRRVYRPSDCRTQLPGKRFSRNVYRRDCGSLLG